MTGDGDRKWRLIQRRTHRSSTDLHAVSGHAMRLIANLALLSLVLGCRPGSSQNSASGGMSSATGGSAGGQSSGGQSSAGGVGGQSATGGTTAKGGATTSAAGGSAGGLSPLGGGSSGGERSAGGVGVSSGGTVAGGSSGSAGTLSSGAGALSSGSTGSSAGAGNTGTPLPNGFKPTTLTADDADAAYLDWKTNHLEDCGGGVFRTRWEMDKLDATVSEGIGYGMLLTVAHDEQAAFDGLWAYYKKGAQGNGLLNWLRYGCDAHRDTKYGQYPDGAASDADLDAAMALIMAKCRWGSSSNGTDYGAAATSLIGSIKANETGTDNGRSYMQPGDSTWFEGMGAGCVNPSYFAPAYYRAFAKFLTSQSDKDFWNKLAEDTYPMLNAGANSSTGLVKNWTSGSGGTAACASSYNNPDEFGSDAARTPWRIATDYVWSGTPAAKTYSDKLTAWVKSKGIASIGLWLKIDGSTSGHADAAKHSVINIGAFACAAVSYDQATADEFAAEVKRMPTASGFDANYFPRCLRAVYLLLLTGGFTTCGGKL